jgi:transposase
VIRQEHHKEGDRHEQRPELKGTRYVWLKRPEHLTVKQAAALEELRPASVGLATARAYRWRLGFDAFFEQPRELAEDYLERWYAGAIRSRLEPIKAFASMIGDHWEGVLRWHWTKINNGVLEAINSLVQASKRRARGYRNKKNLIAMIYLIAGRLDFSSTHAN